MQWKSTSVEDTYSIGKKIIETVSAPFWFLLEGELGVGKTHLTKGMFSQFGIGRDVVSSPTFTYVNEYDGYKGDQEIECFHFDLYRVETEHETAHLLNEYLERFSGAVVCIEWSERLSKKYKEELLQQGFHDIVFTISKDTQERNISIIQ